MGYIKLKLTKVTDESGRTVYSRYGRVESDMPSLDTLETNIIWNALSLINPKSVRLWMKFDKGILDRDMLGEAETLRLDIGILDCDLMK